MKMLFCSVGRRAKLLQNLKDFNPDAEILATDCSKYAPALYSADKTFLSPRIDDPSYLSYILELCKDNSVQAITTLIDSEIEVLSDNREKLINCGVLPLCPSYETAKLCFDKFEMYKFLTERNISTVLTYDSIDDFKSGLNDNKINFPVFIKPKTGSASVGAEKIHKLTQLEDRINSHEDNYFIIQELMDGEDIDVDVYVDCISNKAVSAFSKKKIETKIGGASKTISFKDEALFDVIKSIIPHFEFYGPIDIDFFYKDGQYFLSEINPRFGGAYLHAYGAGVNFYELIQNNINNTENSEAFGSYDEGVVMMMYDDVIIKHSSELA